MGSLWGTFAGAVILGVAQGDRRQDRRRARHARGSSRVPRGAVLQADRPVCEDAMMRDGLSYVVSRNTAVEHGGGLARRRRRPFSSCVPATLCGNARPDALGGRGDVLSRAGADVEPDGGLRRPDVGRHAGLRRRRRPIRYSYLPSTSACIPFSPFRSAASWPRSPRCLTTVSCSACGADISRSGPGCWRKCSASLFQRVACSAAAPGRA